MKEVCRGRTPPPFKIGLQCLCSIRVDILWSIINIVAEKLKMQSGPVNYSKSFQKLSFFGSFDLNFKVSIIQTIKKLRKDLISKFHAQLIHIILIGNFQTT